MKKIRKCFLIISFVIVISFIYFLIMPAITEASAGSDLITNIEGNSNNFISMGVNGLNEKGIDINLDFLEGFIMALYVVLCVCVIAFTIYKAIKYGLSNATDKAAAKMGLARWIAICVGGIGVFPLWKLFVSVFDSSSYTLNIVNQLENTTSDIDLPQNSTLLLILNTILRFIQVLAIGYIIIRLTAVAIKYFTSSAKEKAEVKGGELQKTLIILAIVFGATSFFEIIYKAIVG